MATDDEKPIILRHENGSVRIHGQLHGDSFEALDALSAPPLWEDTFMKMVHTGDIFFVHRDGYTASWVWVGPSDAKIAISGDVRCGGSWIELYVGDRHPIKKNVYMAQGDKGPRWAERQEEDEECKEQVEWVIPEVLGSSHLCHMAPVDMHMSVKRGGDGYGPLPKAFEHISEPRSPGHDRVAQESTLEQIQHETMTAFSDRKLRIDSYSPPLAPPKIHYIRIIKDEEGDNSKLRDRGQGDNDVQGPGDGDSDDDKYSDWEGFSDSAHESSDMDVVSDADLEMVRR